ncbi:hypothetical protein ACIP1T_24910 [Pseudomonas japonica]|uniref:hypothetical protein n=1 Tax=Pseudomonas japonica TaxID=256466 RepID=UPI00382FE061
MAHFSYTATAVDSKNPTRSGLLSAADRQEAEKQVKALFAYPVTVSLKEITLTESAQVLEKVENSWGSKATTVQAVSNTKT